MSPAFFSGTAHVIIAGALGLAILWAAVMLGPVAVERWFF